MTQQKMMTYEEVRAALDAGKALHMDNEGRIVGIVGEIDTPPFIPDIRDAAGWADVGTAYDDFMKAGEYDLAAEYANEWLQLSGDAAFQAPLIDAAARAWREARRGEGLDHLLDDCNILCPYPCDGAGRAGAKAQYDRHMAAGDYDLAAEDAGEWRRISGDAAFWDPLIDAAARAWRESCRGECLDHLRDDVASDSMDWLREPDDCF